MTSPELRHSRAAILAYFFILGVGFAGVKGFAGGFGRGALGAWGEETLKLFVQETIQEALKLESALAIGSLHDNAVIVTNPFLYDE